MKYTIADVEKVLKNQIDTNQKIVLEIENKKVYLIMPDGFNRIEVELWYSMNESLPE